MPRPAISVLLPVRHAADTVAAAVRSVQAQTWPDWELVVVADGADAATLAILQACAAAEPRLRLEVTPPRGIVAALNDGLALCQGEAVARLDADDSMHPERLARQWQCLQADPQTGLVSCQVRYGGSGAGYAAHVDWINSLHDGDTMALRRFVEAPVAHPSVLFRRELVARHGGYRDGAFPEDYELWLRWLEAGVRFAKVPEALLDWNDPPERLSRRDPRYSVEAFYALKLPYLARWLRARIDPARELWLWGAGRVTRRRFAGLEAAGCRFTGYIDVDAAKLGGQRDGRPVRLADDLPPRATSFVIAGVGNRGAREAILAHLLAHGWREGHDFLLAA